MKDKDTAMDSRYRRAYLFNEAIFNKLLKDMTKNEKKQMKEVTFFQGSYFFSARPIPGLEPDKLPLRDPLLVTESGESFTVLSVTHFTKPKCFDGITYGLLDDEVAFDCQCKECPRRSFPTVEELLQHCKNNNHSPMYHNAGDGDMVVADPPTFLQYVNVVLDAALSSRLAKWGNSYIDPKSWKEPTDYRGQSLGIMVYRAFDCSFGYVRPKNKSKAQLGLTVDLRAKIMRNRSLLDELCNGKNPNSVRFTDREIQEANRKWEGEVVIYKLDKKCYSVVALRFDHSAQSLPVEGTGMNHAEYFENRKKHALDFPRARPMIEVQGRRNESIFLPAELVCGNELDSRIREQLPKVASYEPKVRDDALNEMMAFVGNEDHLLASCGIMLNRNMNDNSKARFLPTKAVVMKAPQLIAKGVQLSERYKDNWTRGMQDAWFRKRNPTAGVELKVLVFYNRREINEGGAMSVFNMIRFYVKSFQAAYSFEERPLALCGFEPSDDGYDQCALMKKQLSQDVPENIFVLNFIKQKGKTDPSYPVIKHLLGVHGYLSQFVSFKTFNHAADLGHKKSEMILQGVARQILQKSGVQLWWVSLPRELPLPAVFVGVDIFHSPRQYSKEQGQRVRKPSCAAIVVQLMRETSEQSRRVEIYSETHIVAGGQESGLADRLRRTVQSAMKAFHVNPASDIKSCIVWRDGISESSFDTWAKEEISGVRQGLTDVGDLTAAFLPDQQSYYGPTGELKEEVPSGAVVVKKEVRSVPLAYIVCQKRIATKFLTQGVSANGDSLEGLYGAPSGTLVDGIQGLKKQDIFYIQGRAPPGSTPKPVRYITIEKDEELKGRNELDLRKLTWDMCHDYPNWTGPIKVPSVCMCAHKLAMLAGMMPHKGGEEIAHRRFTNKMHFL